MFGYITPNQDELKIREYRQYRSFYCGLCRQLKASYGPAGQLSLSYDMTFLALLLTALYEEPVENGFCRCLAHPFEKHPVSRNCFSDYAADMNLILTYYKCEDDWMDEKKLSRRLYAGSLQRKMKKLQKKYPGKCKLIAENLKAIQDYERSGQYDLDTVSGYFGTILGAVFACREDVWKDTLQEMGFFFGKFIYLLDAYEDLDKDLKKSCYNPFTILCQSPTFQEDARQILTLLMADCCRAFERLPILEYAEILRNILYSGVWTRFHLVNQKKEEQTHGKSL